MDTTQLKLFLSVAQTLNFTKTAGEFFMTQPTVSNAIKSLENGLGVKLLNRDSHNVSLTPEGEAFVGYAGQMLKLELEAENRLRNITQGRRGYLRIAMLSSAMELFSTCLSEFFEKYPAVQVDVDVKEGADLMRAIVHGAYDIYFANEYMMTGSQTVDYAVTDQGPLHLFMHRSIADTIDLDDWSTLNNHHFVSVTDTDFALSGRIEQICMRRGVTPDIISFYNRADTLLLAVNAGIGITILPPSLNYLYSFPNVVAKPISGEDAVIAGVVAWQKTSENPDAHRFLQLDALRLCRDS